MSFFVNDEPEPRFVESVGERVRLFAFFVSKGGIAITGKSSAASSKRLVLSCNQSVKAEASPAASGDATGPGSANDTAGEDPAAACSKAATATSFLLLGVST